MRNCWEAQPEKRPSFSDLVQILSSKLVVIAEYMDFSPGVASTTEALIKPQNGNIKYEETAV